MIAPCRSAISTSSGSGPMSPSMENTPSVISSLWPLAPLQIRHDLLRRRRVLVRKHVDLRARQPAAVDDAGVIQRVGNDVVFRTENRGNSPCVRREAGLKHHARFGMLELRDAPLQLHVDAHGAGDRSHRARSRAVCLRGGHLRFDQLGMIGQPEVVVAARLITSLPSKRDVGSQADSSTRRR